jgi:NAD-dependent SIR2 family protein deacetylase
VYAALQRKMAAEGRKLSIITQNIDRLHQVIPNGRPTSIKPMSVVS